MFSVPAGSHPVIAWAPRVLTLAFAAFLAVFALDVFDEAQGLGPTLLALVMHLLPSTFLVLALLAVAWRWEWVGAVAFAGLAVFYVAAFRERVHWTAHLGITTPLVILSLLWLAAWFVHRSSQGAPPLQGG